MLQVVAGVVLAQGLQTVPDPAVGEHDFEPEDEVAGVAVGEDRDAAGIAGQCPADPRRAPRGIGQREQQAGGIGRILHLGEDRAGLDHDAGIDRIEPDDAVHPRQRQNHAAMRHAAADETGISALRHHRDARRRAGFDHEGDLRGRTGSHRSEGGAAIKLARLDEIGIEVGRVGQHMGGTQALAQSREKRVLRGRALSGRVAKG